jgi:tetratricopeptide (TPR) repeat protein
VKRTATVPVPRAALTLQAGLAHHRAGEHIDAERCYRQVLAAVPSHPDGLHLLGALLAERGSTEGISLLIRAIAARPKAAEYRLTLGNAYLAAGDLTHAASRYREALARDPSLWPARSNLGHVLRLQGRRDQARQELERVVDQQPNAVEAVMNHPAR